MALLHRRYRRLAEEPPTAEVVDMAFLMRWDAPGQEMAVNG